MQPQSKQQTFYHGVILLLLAVMFLSSGCKRSQEDAIGELQSRHIPFTEKVFLNYLIRGDTEVASIFIDAGVDPNLQVDVREAGYPTPPSVYKQFPNIPILLIAMERQHQDIEELLIKAGADKEKAISIAKAYTKAESDHYDALKEKVEQRLRFPK